MAGDRAAMDRLREICLALPEVDERLSHGAVSFFIGRQFVAVDDHHHGADRLAFWCPAPPGVQEQFIAEDSEQFFRPPYVGHRGWVGVRIDLEPDWDEICEIVRDAYRQVAPKRLVAAGTVKLGTILVTKPNIHLGTTRTLGSALPRRLRRTTSETLVTETARPGPDRPRLIFSGEAVGGVDHWTVSSDPACGH